MYLRKSSFQLILYACVFQLKDHMVLYSGYTDPYYKTMVFYSAPLLCLRVGHFSNAILLYGCVSSATKEIV